MVTGRAVGGSGGVAGRAAGGGSIAVYYDGALVYGASATVSLGPEETLGFNNSEPWNGAIDQVRVFDRQVRVFDRQVRVFDRALTVAEIALLAAE